MHSFLQKFGRSLVIWLPLGWLGIFFMLPLVEMVNVSLSEARRAVPPYNPAFQIGKDGISFQPVVDNYLLIYEYWEDYLWPAVNSVRLAFFSTLYCLLFARVFLRARVAESSELPPPSVSLSEFLF